jgi:hypothetical protein
MSSTIMRFSLSHCACRPTPLGASLQVTSFVSPAVASCVHLGPHVTITAPVGASLTPRHQKVPSGGC